MLTPDKLDGIRRRCEAATKGPGDRELIKANSDAAHNRIRSRVIAWKRDISDEFYDDLILFIDQSVGATDKFLNKIDELVNSLAEREGEVERLKQLCLEAADRVSTLRQIDTVLAPELDLIRRLRKAAGARP